MLIIKQIFIIIIINITKYKSCSNLKVILRSHKGGGMREEEHYNRELTNSLQLPKKKKWSSCNTPTSIPYLEFVQRAAKRKIKTNIHNR